MYGNVNDCVGVKLSKLETSYSKIYPTRCNCYCYLPLAAGSSNGVTNIRCCRYSCLRAPDDGWWYTRNM